MTPETPETPEARFVAFTEDERDVMHFAFTSAASRIMDDALADRIPAETLDSAAGTFLYLSNLSRQLDLVAGRPAPGADGAMIVAAMIAAGEAPEAAKHEENLIITANGILAAREDDDEDHPERRYGD
jgi:hypothetical protein